MKKKGKTTVEQRFVLTLEVDTEKPPYLVETADQLWSCIVDDILIKYGDGIMITLGHRHRTVRRA